MMKVMYMFIKEQIMSKSPYNKTEYIVKHNAIPYDVITVTRDDVKDNIFYYT